jgi:hypothetical protein
MGADGLTGAERLDGVDGLHREALRGTRGAILIA